VLVAPSTSQDPEQDLLRAALDGLAGAPVRMIASSYARTGASPLPSPVNAVLAPWMSYSRTMRACDVVVSHGGHGTLALALTSGCRVVVCPAAGDMAESAARVDWAGVGVRLPRRLLTPRTLRLAVERALRSERMAARARAIAAWAVAHDGAQAAAGELEAWRERLG
jgi:UDP:flavonoid glycosyltransferase YjiC (YdhE family)